MIVDTDQLDIQWLRLVEQYGRSIAMRAESLAADEASVYRPLTDSWIEVFLRRRPYHAKRLKLKEEKK